MAKKLSNKQTDILMRIAAGCRFVEVRTAAGLRWSVSAGDPPNPHAMRALFSARLLRPVPFTFQGIKQFEATLTDAGRQALEDNRG